MIYLFIDVTPQSLFKDKHLFRKFILANYRIA